MMKYLKNFQFLASFKLNCIQFLRRLVENHSIFSSYSSVLFCFLFFSFVISSEAEDLQFYAFLKSLIRNGTPEITWLNESKMIEITQVYHSSDHIINENIIYNNDLPKLILDARGLNHLRGYRFCNLIVVVIDFVI